MIFSTKKRGRFLGLKIKYKEVKLVYLLDESNK